MYNKILEVKEISKYYNEEKVLDDINLSMNKGEIYGLMGRNGAGKTTLMKIVTGLTNQSGGTVSCMGNVENIDFSKIGLLIEYPALFEDFTAYDNLKMKCICANISNIDEHIKELLKSVNLLGVENKKVKKFSLGMKQRLGIALALVGNPTLLVLDEPINGLDPQGIVEVRNILQNLAEQGISIIISSHILDELYKLATNFSIIEQGKLVCQITKDELTAICQNENISLEQFYLNTTGGNKNVSNY